MFPDLTDSFEAEAPLDLEAASVTRVNLTSHPSGLFSVVAPTLPSQPQPLHNQDSREAQPPPSQD